MTQVTMAVFKSALHPARLAWAETEASRHPIGFRTRPPAPEEQRPVLSPGYIALTRAVLAARASAAEAPQGEPGAAGAAAAGSDGPRDDGGQRRRAGGGARERSPADAEDDAEPLVGDDVADPDDLARGIAVWNAIVRSLVALGDAPEAERLLIEICRRTPFVISRADAR